jgi:hypothetical protein
MGMMHWPLNFLVLYDTVSFYDTTPISSIRFLPIDDMHDTSYNTSIVALVFNRRFTSRSIGSIGR